MELKVKISTWNVGKELRTWTKSSLAVKKIKESEKNNWGSSKATPQIKNQYYHVYWLRDW